MAQFCFNKGILTATLISARSPRLILNLISSQYSQQLALLTEKTYSSKLQNSSFLHMAIILSTQEFYSQPLFFSNFWKPYLKFKLREKSTSSIAPGMRPDSPNMIESLLIVTSSRVNQSAHPSIYFFYSPYTQWGEIYFCQLFVVDIEVTLILSSSLSIYQRESSQFSFKFQLYRTGTFLFIFYCISTFIIILSFLFFYIRILSHFYSLQNRFFCLLFYFYLSGLCGCSFIIYQFSFWVRMNINKRRKFSYIHSLQSTKNKLQEYFQYKQFQQFQPQTIIVKKKALQIHRSKSLANNSTYLTGRSAIEFKSPVQPVQSQIKKIPNNFQNLLNIKREQNNSKDSNKLMKSQQNFRYNNKNHQSSSQEKQRIKNKIKRPNSSYNLSQQESKSPNTLFVKQKIRKSQQISRQNTNSHSQRMLKLEQKFNQQCLFKRLCQFSKQKNKKSIRIYRDIFEKVFSHRYGKDIITSFFNFQYIQDFDSITKTMRQMFQLKQQEVLLTSFLFFDQNRDGLITPADMMNIVGAKRQNCQVNTLAMQDLHRVNNYLRQKAQKNQQLIQKISFEYLFTKDQGLTLSKYRLICRKEQKLKQRKQKIRYMSKKINLYLYTMREESEQKSMESTSRKQEGNYNSMDLLSLVVKSKAKKQTKDKQSYAFNFETFKKIFQNTIPHIFIDFLYVLGGLQLPELLYTKLDTSILIKQQQKKQQIYVQKGIPKIKRMLQEMKIDRQICETTYRTMRR